MIEAITYTDMLWHINKSELVEDTIGILITRPDLNTGNDIMKSLNYYHHLTSKNINFYLPGYGAYWNTENYPDMNIVTNINGVNWFFSDKAFVDFIETLEKVSKWKYSGESELFLIPYYDKTLDFSEVGIFHLDTMLNDATISSVSSFITGLSRYFKHTKSITSIAACGAVKCIAKTVLEEIIDNIPTCVSRPLVRGRHYLCKDFSIKK